MKVLPQLRYLIYLFMIVSLLLAKTEVVAQNSAPCAETDRVVLFAFYAATNGGNWKNNTNWLSDKPLSEWYGVLTNEQGCVSGLRLASNDLSGFIPKEVGNLVFLESMNLQLNEIGGTIPIELENLVNLEHLFLSFNKLQGTIPTQLGKLKKLELLFLEVNQLVGTIPVSLGDLESLTYCVLSYNQLQGNIPEELGNLEQLVSLGLDNNQLSGPLPTSLGYLTNIATFNVQNNLLVGSFPDSYTNLCYLTTDSINTFCIEAQDDLPNCQYNFSNNDGLPWQGDFNRFCNEGVLANSCAERDRAALVTLYQTMDGDNWIRNDNWLTDAPLNEWYGVETNEQGCVSVLKLDGSVETNSIVRGNGLNGVLPDALWTLTDLEELSISDGQLGVIRGTIDDQLLQLTKLRRLIIAGGIGRLIEGSIPENIGNLKDLEFLFLSNNRLTGEIPSSIGELENLKVISLYNNRLTGQLPVEISQLKNLVDLNIYGNRFEGMIPPEYGQLTNLNYLGLAFNQLTGEIPVEFSNLKALRSLGVGENNLVGPIPPELGQLSNLVSLFLRGNQLSGSIPASLGDLKKMERMDLSSNNLSGCFPENLRNLCHLTTDLLSDFNCQWNDNELEGCQFDFRNNPDLSWEGDFSRFCNGETQSDQACNGLFIGYPWLNTYVDLQNCTTENILEFESSGQRYLRITTSESVVLYNKDGQLYCTYRENYNCEDFYPIEQIIAEWTCTNSLSCEERDKALLADFYQAMDGDNWINKDNWLSDAPLNEWYGVTTNKHGCVSGLDLDGYLDEKIIGSGNGLKGTLPASLWKLVDLESLNLSESRNGTLEGMIDEQLLQLTKLRSLQITGGGDRLITGSIPENIGVLKNLESIFMPNNRLTGPIPVSIGDLENLKSVSLYNNRLSGTLPVEIGKLKELTWLNIYGNNFIGSIPPTYGQLENLWMLGLSGNYLTGEIPVELSNLKELRYFGLGRNDLSGPIPPELGQLTKLISLGLSDNRLSGSIPESFGNLTNMERMNLSSNNLSGCFPESLRNLCYLTTDLLSDFNCQSNNNVLEGCQFDFRDNPNLQNNGDFASFCSSPSSNCETEVTCTTPAFEEQGRILVPSRGHSFCTAVDDLDGDGDLDIVRGGFTNFGPDGNILENDYNFSWLRNEGNNNFTEIIFFEDSRSRLLDVAVNDIDQDGDLDIIASFDLEQKLVVYEQTSTGAFLEKILASDVTFFDMQLADLNNDDFLDIVVSSPSNAIFNWFQNLGDIQFQEKTISEEVNRISDVYIEDLDQDGFQDILVTQFSGNERVAVFFNDGADAFRKEVISNNLPAPFQILAGNYNEDELMDLLVLSLDNEVYYLENLGGNQFSQEMVLQVSEDDPPPYGFTNFPIDNNQEAVLLLFNGNGKPKPDMLNLLQYENGIFTNRVIVSETGVETCPITIDFDGDGLLDMIASSENGSDIRWFKQIVCEDLTESTPDIEKPYSLLQVESMENADKMKVIQTYPNPFSRSTNLLLLLPENSAVQLEIFSVTGQLVFQKAYNLVKGHNQIQLDGYVFPESGLYFYQINNERELFSGTLNKI